jgi:Methyltransferase domain
LFFCFGHFTLQRTHNCRGVKSKVKVDNQIRIRNGLKPIHPSIGIAEIPIDAFDEAERNWVVKHHNGDSIYLKNLQKGNPKDLLSVEEISTQGIYSAIRVRVALEEENLVTATLHSHSSMNSPLALNRTSQVSPEMFAEYDQYIRKVGFRYYGPLSQLKGFCRLTHLSERFDVLFEMVNTRLPQGESNMKRRLRPLCRIPRMSTFAVGAIINHTVSCMKPDVSFVNVGVWNGFTLLSGMVGNSDKRCVGVDNFSEFGGPREQFLSRFNTYKSEAHHFYDSDYRDYFKNNHSGEIGFYIYDGSHSYENQMAGLKIAEPFLGQDAIVLVDDTNGVEPRQATLDFISQNANKYELLLDTCTPANKHPTFWNGIMVFRKC